MRWALDAWANSLLGGVHAGAAIVAALKETL